MNKFARMMGFGVVIDWRPLSSLPRLQEQLGARGLWVPAHTLQPLWRGAVRDTGVWGRNAFLPMRKYLVGDRPRHHFIRDILELCQLFCPQTLTNVGARILSQVVINAGVLPNLLRLLSANSEKVRKQACFVLSNITAGTEDQLQVCLSMHASVRIWGCVCRWRPHALLCWSIAGLAELSIQR